ncbi:alpha/beta fold hydrolase [Ferrovibrio sp.]|uniref:alpha/beta fold hydrolase n=1 Tax=Ferrovibrio sp. TaxID=1917215 RepID=UPI003D2778B7
MRVSFVTVGGRQTRILCGGEGPALLLLHGLGTTAERWYRVIDRLAEKFFVVAPDLLNSGFSADVSFAGGTPQDIHCQHIFSLAECLGLTNAAVVGSSYGGLLAALLAIRHPLFVRQLVIVGSGSAFHPPDEQVATLMAARDNAMKAANAGTLDAMRQRMRHIVFSDKGVSEESLPILLTSNAQPGRQQALIDLYEGLISASEIQHSQAYHRLEQIRTSTLVITGRNDIRAAWQRAEEAAKRIPDCQLKIYDECGHAPMIEHTDRFCDDLFTFLTAR